MTAATPTLVLSDLSGGYAQRQVLRGVTLEPLRPGTVTALLGPNGAGKSTLLRAMAGLVPARGSIRWGTQEMLRLDIAARARHLAFMPQAVPPAVMLTVLETVVVAARTAGSAAPAGDLKARAIATLDRLGIINLAFERIDRLSGGQRQLVGFAQAIVRDPDILLLDEPTSALDLRNQHEVMRAARDFSRTGRVVVMVLHDLHLALQWADRIVLLAHGRVHAEGEPAAVLTPEALSEVYGVTASVEKGAGAHLHIRITGTRPETASVTGPDTPLRGLSGRYP